MSQGYPAHGCAVLAELAIIATHILCVHLKAMHAYRPSCQDIQCMLACFDCRLVARRWVLGLITSMHVVRHEMCLARL